MLNNYNRIRENLGYSGNDRAFRDALAAAGINPRKADKEGIPESTIQKIKRFQPALNEKSDVPTPNGLGRAEVPTSNGLGSAEPTVAIEQVQAKLGVDAETMVHLCQEFGLSSNRPLAQSEAFALCELAQEMYGNQLDGELSFINDRQSLMFRQQQDTAFQLGYLQESVIDNAHQRGRIQARSKQLGKQETEVRTRQEQVFSLLGQAGKQLKPQGKSADQSHQEFTLGLWS